MVMLFISVVNIASLHIGEVFTIKPKPNQKELIVYRLAVKRISYRKQDSDLFL